MDFVKKHYEKVILSAVLLGVVGFLVFMVFMISHDRERLRTIADQVTNPIPKPLPALDLARQESVMKRAKAPVSFDFSTTNRLFNPLEWKKAADGTWFPIRSGKETGPAAVVVTNITPLYFIITLDSVETNGLTPRYAFGVERQAAASPALRRKQQRYVSVGEKKDAFTLLKVEGDPADPTACLLKLADGGDVVSVSKAKPFERVEGYAADLIYEPEKKSFTGYRVGSYLQIGGEYYIIVAIDAHEVILSAQSNQKKTTLRYVP